MIALFAAAALAATPAPSCGAADPAVTDIHVKLMKKRTPDHYVVTVTVTNVGSMAQVVGLTQYAELVRDGKVVAEQDVPALGAGVPYVVAFGIDRAVVERKNPLPVTVRFVLAKGDRARNDCNLGNDVLSQTF
jgi:hypothetical protein